MSSKVMHEKMVRQGNVTIETSPMGLDAGQGRVTIEVTGRAPGNQDTRGGHDTSPRTLTLTDGELLVLYRILNDIVEWETEH